MSIAGLQLVIPSSVSGSGVSLSATGKITLTAATSWSVNGCFTSTYDNYLMVGQVTPSTGHAPSMYLRASGTDNTASYRWQELAADGTSLTGGRGAGDYSFMYFSYTLNKTGIHNFIYAPALAQNTVGRIVSIRDETDAKMVDLAWKHSVASAFDGFSVVSGGGASLTGTLCIYGLSE